MKDQIEKLQTKDNKGNVPGSHLKPENRFILREEDRYLFNPDTLFSNKKLNILSNQVPDFKSRDNSTMRSINFESICLFSNHNTPPVPISINKIQINNN
jgi:hypothetical protein